MNFIILGDEITDFKHQVLSKRKLQQENPDHPLTEDERLIKTVRVLQSSSYASDIEKLRLYYKEKAFRLKSIFEQCLVNFGIFNMPSGGLAAWIELNEALDISGITASLADLGLFDEKLNPQFKPDQPIHGIRVGFGTVGIETYEKAFRQLAAHFRQVTFN